MRFLRRYFLPLLLGAIPVAIILALFAPERQLLVFGASAVAVVPLSAYVGRATEALTEHLGAGIAGLLNATFGNAPELVIGAVALHAGLTDLVKASITGSLISNVLLVFGASALVGGLGHRVQRFNRTAASLGTTMLLLSTVGLVVPAVFHRLSARLEPGPELALNSEIAVVLFAIYCLSLVFTLKTHRTLYSPSIGRSSGREPSTKQPAVRESILVLLVATAALAVVSELLVRTVSDAGRQLGVSHLFIGVVVVGIVGNAAEHYSAIVLAAKGKMDAPLAIAVGSATQIALFVTPSLVFLSYLVAPSAMDLLFSGYEVVAITLAVLSIAFVAQKGETHWMDGVQLLAVYVILCLGFYFIAD
jgi:Ca2+:H+ antiporter